MIMKARKELLYLWNGVNGNSKSIKSKIVVDKEKPHLSQVVQ